MAGKQDDLLKRPLYVFGLPYEVLSTLSVKEGSDDLAALSALSEDSLPTPSTSQNDNTVGSLACSLCSLSFTTLADQRSHGKSDLHQYNLKLKLRGQNAVSEVEFEALVEQLDESLSGSDSEGSEDSEEEKGNTKEDSTLTALLKKQARIADEATRSEADDDNLGSVKLKNKGKPPLLWFSSSVLPPNHYFGLYRVIMTSQDLRSESLVSVVRAKQLEPVKPIIPNKDGTPPSVPYKGPHYFLCMIGGGHFAAMVVSLAPRLAKGTTMNREATVLAHKTFHRYTTRRKQGGSQGLHDNANGQAHSVGSSLRRYNEEALRKDIRVLLSDWKSLIDTSELLFVRATGSTNRGTLFGPYEGQVLQHNDQRLRGFPFTTKRATQNELMRSFIELTRLKVREIDPEKEKAKQTSTVPVKTSGPTLNKPTKPKLTEGEETALLHTSQIQNLTRRSKLPALLSYLTNNNISPDFELQPADQHYHAPRLLHLAASSNAAPLILGLLTRGGADPTLSNRDGKTAFDLAGDRATRDAFRVARSELGESKWRWDLAHVPAPLSKADASRRDEQERKEAESKEAQRRRAEEERLRVEGPKLTEDDAKKKRTGGGGSVLGAGMAKTPQEKREEESRGLTPEMRMKLERERRARAAEARMKALQGK